MNVAAGFSAHVVGNGWGFHTTMDSETAVGVGVVLMMLLVVLSWFDR